MRINCLPGESWPIEVFGIIGIKARFFNSLKNEDERATEGEIDFIEAFVGHTFYEYY